MDGEELLNSLQRDAEARVKAVWAEAEAEAARLQADQEAANDALRSCCLQQNSGDIERRKADVMTRAKQEAAGRRLAAEQALAARLLPLAAASLPALREGGADGLLEDLSREIPSLPWEQIRVNPRDAEHARTLFPGATIVTDEGIAGGIEASTAGLSIRVVNTLEKRLLNAWDEILPKLMERCHGAIHDR